MSITWPIAKSSDGEYVHISDAVRGEAYFCPECLTPFIARMGQKVRWHFAHYPGVICTGEGARHSIAKHYIAQFLAVRVNIPLQCECSESTNKLYSISFSDIKVEDSVKGFRVDVTARLEQQVLCLEVVDSHHTEAGKSADLGDTLVEIKIKDLKDDEIFAGDSVRDRLVEQLGFHLPKRFIRPYAFFHTWKTPCYRCKRVIPVVSQCHEMWPNSLPTGLLAEMRKCAKLEPRKTSVVKEGYFANVCPGCGAVQGDWFLRDDLLELCASGQAETVETHLWIDR